MKSLLALCFSFALLAPALAQRARDRQREPEIVAAPPGVMIDFYPVSDTRIKGGRYISTPELPRLGYIAAVPALQVERLRSVNRIRARRQTAIEAADGKRRVAETPVPAIQMTLLPNDARAFEKLMRQHVGQRIYIEAEGTPIYAPLVREALPATTLTFNLADDAQAEEVFAKLRRFVKR